VVESPKLILSAPPGGKLPKDMTPDERRAWANAIFDAMASQRPVVEAAGVYLRQRGERGSGTGSPG